MTLRLLELLQRCPFLQMDESADLVAAFECFDERDEGKIDAAELRYWLSEVGDRMKPEEVSSLVDKIATIDHTDILYRLIVFYQDPLWTEEATSSTTRHVSMTLTTDAV